MNLACVFLLGGALGYVWEAGVVQKERPSDTTCRYLYGRPFPFLVIYGVIAVALVVAHHYLQNFSVLTEGMIFGLIIVALECLGGKTSKAFNSGLKTWDYSKGPGYVSPLHFADGYCCLEASLLWAALGLLLAWCWR